MVGDLPPSSSDTGISLSAAMRAIWINTYKLFSISTPFSGWKESGMGREKGRLGIREYMQQKSLYWGLNDAPLAWAN